MPTTLASQLTESALLLVVGMAVVFIFLTLLIGAVHLISAFCAKYPGVQDEPKPVRRVANRSKDEGLSPSVVAAIGAAVHQYRKEHQK